MSPWCRQPIPICGLCVHGSDYHPAPGGPRHPLVIQHAAERQAARRAHRTAPVVVRGRANRRAGHQAEQRIARLLGGTIVPGSGQLDGLPNDVRLPDGWRAEVRRRDHGFRTLYRALGDADVALWTPDPTGPSLVALWADRLALVHERQWLTRPWAVARVDEAIVGIPASVFGAVILDPTPTDVGVAFRWVSELYHRYQTELPTAHPVAPMPLYLVHGALPSNPLAALTPTR